MPPFGSSEPAACNFHREFRSIEKEVGKLLSTRERDMERQAREVQIIEALQFRVEQLRRAFFAGTPILPAPKSPGGPGGLVSMISTFSIEKLDEDYFRVVFDGGRAFNVATLEGELLKTLAEELPSDSTQNGPQDELVDFKSSKHLLEAAQKSGHACGWRAMVQRISRLRDFMEEAGYGRLLIERQGRRTYRLRLRRTGPTLFE
jgi:hypothetical protein